MLFVLTTATIHNNRQEAFHRTAGQELESQIWEYYLDIVYRYGNYPRSPILSLEKTQALCPMLTLFALNGTEHSITVTLPEDRYLTLHVTDDIQDNDLLTFFFSGENCESLSPNVLSPNGRILGAENISSYSYYSSPWRVPVQHIVIVEKDELNTDLERGT